MIHNIGSVMQSCVKILSVDGILNPQHEAMLLVEHVCNVDEKDLVIKNNIEISDDIFDRLIEMSTVRASTMMPIPYIIGIQYFFGHRFIVKPCTLIPRYDSESLLNAIIQKIRYSEQRHYSIIDLYSGTGCLGISLAHYLLEQDVCVSLTLVDCDPNVMDVAIQNTKHLLIQQVCTFVVTDLLCHQTDISMHGCHDIIIANPPYIPSSNISTLDVSVKHFEPLLALDGGHDGMIHYRAITNLLPYIMHSNSMCVVEIDDLERTTEIFSKSYKDMFEIIYDMRNDPRGLLISDRKK